MSKQSNKSKEKSEIKSESLIHLLKPISSKKKGSDPNETRFLDIIQPWQKNQKGPGLAVVGVPFDNAVLGRKGAKGGPEAIRNALRYFKAYNLGEDFWFGDKSIKDFGNVIIKSDKVIEEHQRIEKVLHEIVSLGFTPITLGGDHSIGYPVFKGLRTAMAEKSFGLVNLDAHLDVRESINNFRSSGTPFRKILEDELITGENFVEIGLRNFTNGRGYRKFADDHGITMFTTDDIHSNGLDWVIQQTIKQINKNTNATYLSVDLDGLDVIYAPGVSAPTPFGLSPREVIAIINELSIKTPLQGMDIVELNPKYDTSDITAINAASFAVQFSSNYYQKKPLRRKISEY
jgi:formimidoylglutamase